ncbi:hypothetical protein T02_1756 [Trichinella nativa]|uniref:Uncharacterized protein n=1 Tax=Trichinella nativa TaxID=6335 RepID=A0A0V1KJX3_9BILA|nr:hypothetical protein T02_6249 [Trichinella nativa]KRZ47930.1 hypothetical protein T02_1756 [Trichinella nativa]
MQIRQAATVATFSAVMNKDRYHFLLLMLLPVDKESVPFVTAAVKSTSLFLQFFVWHHFLAAPLMRYGQIVAVALMLNLANLTTR